MSVAFVFPGQGSQSVGMLGELAQVAPAVRQTFEQASSVLGYDLWAVVQEGPEEELNRTSVTQPAMLSAGVAVWRAWQARGGVEPVAMAGHSLGEYTALVCADSLDFEAAIALVAERGRLMQEAVPAGEGAMAALLGLDDATVIDVCERAGEGQVVSAVNFNAPGQVVVAGHKDAVDRAVALAKTAGAKRAVVLPVSVPSHCALMQPAAERLAERLREVEFEAPRIPVINNADVEAATDHGAIRDALARQLHSPVRWVETIQAMAGRSVDKLVECGPGKVLVGLNKRIAREMTAFPVFDPEGLDKALSETL